MSKKKKGNIKFAFAVALIAIVVGSIWVWIYSFQPPNENQIEKLFKRDRINIELIAEYFTISNYSSISVTASDIDRGIMFTGVASRNVTIEDEEVKNAIKRLLKKQGYRRIGRYGNTIYFQVWTMLEQERGITYSIDGENNPALEFLTEFEPLSVIGWYYYEADYNEWRRRNN